MRMLERQLCVLPDLLNSCPRHASKVTRARTLANMLAAAPLASSMFREVDQGVPWVDKLVRIYLDHNPCYHCNWGKSFSALRCIKVYLRYIMSQQHLNNIYCSSMSTRLWRMDWICSPSPGSSWTPMNGAGISLAPCTVHSETHQSDRELLD